MYERLQSSLGLIRNENLAISYLYCSTEYRCKKKFSRDNYWH